MTGGNWRSLISDFRGGTLFATVLGGPWPPLALTKLHQWAGPTGSGVYGESSFRESVRKLGSLGSFLLFS